MGSLKITLPAKTSADISKKKSSPGCRLRFLTTNQVKNILNRQKKTSAQKNKKNDPFQSALLEKGFKGEKNKLLPLYGTAEADILLLVGLGEEKDLSADGVRKVAGTAMRCVKSFRKDKLFVEYFSSKNVSENLLFKSTLEGFLLGSYEFTQKLKVSEKKEVKEIIFEGFKKQCSQAIKPTEVLCESVCFARNLVNGNARDVTPLFLAREASKIAKQYRLKSTVLDEKSLKSLGCGLMLAVGKGALEGPKLITLEYRKGGKNKKTIALVGKGITFDSGGLNLKPSGHIETMRQDMAGAAAVLGAMKAVASMKLPVNVVGVMACAENMIGKEAYKPGDIIRASNGKTVEVLNTDAEGRLVLADALCYVEKKIKPDYIVDVATLTGAALVSFGSHYAPFLTKNASLKKALLEASEKSDEKIWELPLSEPYLEDMTSDIADLRNTGKTRYAGTIQGAVFLKHFVEKTPWAHLDIAGTAWASEASGCVPKYGTGFGVRLFVELCSRLSQ